MRAHREGPVLKVRAIAGLHVVVLAWDFTKRLDADADGLPPELKGLLGFSIERDELGADGESVESYVLRGIKRFRGKDDGAPAGTPLPLDEHPVQSFCWADYTAKPGTRYRYRVTPMYGRPKLLAPRHEATVEVAVTTESETDPREPGDGRPRHDVYANRGVIGSQAYARRFQNQAPDPEAPSSEPMKWLSRGLYEALLSFIGLARSERFALRAAFYEFQGLLMHPWVNSTSAGEERGLRA